MHRLVVFSPRFGAAVPQVDGHPDVRLQVFNFSHRLLSFHVDVGNRADDNADVHDGNCNGRVRRENTLKSKTTPVNVPPLART